LTEDVVKGPLQNTGGHRTLIISFDW